MLAAACIAPSVFAASQTWTNTPVSSAWATAGNWVGNAVPGAVNSSTSADVASFINPIAGGFGGAANPILNDVTRGIRSILFDTVGCGAYTFGNSLNDNFLDIIHLGNISMNSTVVNPVSFNQGLRTRVPSSTNLRYDLTNNAASVNATLFFAAITNSSASTRPCSMFLGGSNTGTNTVALFDDNAGANGAILLDKVGTGTWIFSGPNNLPQKTSAGNVAHVFVNEGKLVVKDASSLGTITAGNLVVTNSTLQIDGVSLNNNGLTVRNGGLIRMNGSGTVNGVTVGNQASTTVTLSTVGASDVLTVGNVVNQPTGGAADSVLRITGAGTVIMNQTANYVGKYSVDAGSLALTLTGTLGTGANLNIAAGGTFDLTAQGAVTYPLTTAAISGTGTGTSVGSTAATIKADPAGIMDLATGAKGISLTFTPTAFSGDTAHPSLYVSQGTLSLGNNTFTVNNAAGTALGVGTYRLIQQAAGTVTSAGGYAVTVTGTGKAAGTVAAITVVGGNVNLEITAYVPKNLVWTGGSLNANWNTTIDANWLNGAAASIFNISDNVTFNGVGSTNPTVNLVGTLSPGSVVVDTAANDYTFSGTGQIGGSTSLTKNSSGKLTLSTINSYSGGTVVNNGTLALGANNAIPSTGAGDVAVISPAVLDLSGFSDVINALTGSGKVDVQNGGTSVLTVGNNNNGGTFTGTINNTSGTLALVKEGNGSEILTSSNSYVGATTLNHGTLVAGDEHALGTGSDLSVNNGTLDMKTNLFVNSLAGSGGVIANNSTTTTNTLVIQGATTTIYAGSIANGSGGGGVAVKVLGGSLRLNSGTTYTGGTIVGSGASFLIGNNVGAGVTGSVVASNTATLGLPGGSTPPGTPVDITTVGGASVTFTSGAEGNSWGSQFLGSATATNRFIGPVSVGGVSAFQNFNGVVQFALASGNFRFFNTPSLNGGTNTAFEFVAGNVHTRDAQTVELGAVRGGSSTSGIGGNGTGGTVSTWSIGAKGLSTTFEGYISGSNNLVKVGPGSLTLDGLTITTNTDSATYTNYLYAPLISYLGNTTVSNGTLALIVPNSLTNCTTITLAGAGAVLDATKMGYVSDQVDISLTVTNQVLVTNGVFELYAGQTLRTFAVSGLAGSVLGSVVQDAGSTLTMDIGTLAVSGAFASQGTINMELNNTNAQNSDRITAGGAINLNGASLVVTNTGADLVTGNVFTLFNKAVTGTFALSLPAQNAAATITYVYQTNLVAAGSSPAGTIKVLVGASAVNPTPAPITPSVSGSTLTLTWPADHIGWKLQVQTNTISTGIASNWFDVAGSTTVNTMNFPINPANGSVFYRMVLP